MRRGSLLFWMIVWPVLAAARPFTVLVFNTQNLHDVDGVAVYEDQSPAHYTPAHALTKVTNIAEVVARVGDGNGPEVILFQEIEIDQTPSKKPLAADAVLRRYAGTSIQRMLGEGFNEAVADLSAEVLLLKAFVDRGMSGYTVVAGTDGGIGDAGLAIKSVVFTRFPVTSVRNHPVTRARNILEVALDVDGHPLIVFANHWKSGASDAETEQVRIQNARVLRERIDVLLKADPHVDIIIGGDLNAHYNQKRRYRKLPETSINDVLGSQGNELAVRGPARDLYNLWFELPEAERGSDVYKGEWGTLMHLIVARGLYDRRGVQYIDNSFGVARFPGLNADAAGLPVRWNAREGPGGYGYSDHFPIYARFQTTDENRPGVFIPLVRGKAGDEAEGDRARKVDMAQTDFASAIVLANLPPDTRLRDGTWTGKLFRVEANALDHRYLKIEVNGDVYDVYGPRKEIRELLYAQRRENNGALSFYGELGTYKGNWQFLVKAKEWVK